MARIDPHDEKWDNSDGSPVGSGRKLFAVIGYEHFGLVPKKGKNKDRVLKVCEVRSVCISDLEGGEDEGNDMRDLFFLHSDGALGRFVSFARDGCGRTEPFDPDLAAEVKAIVEKQPFVATVKATKDGKYTNHDCGWTYEAPDLERDPSTGECILEGYQKEIIQAARKRWDGYVNWRRDNPRPHGYPGGTGEPDGYETEGGGQAGGSGYDSIPF